MRITEDQIRNEKHKIVCAIKEMFYFLQNDIDYIGSVKVKDIFTWAEKMSSYEDKTYITAEWLVRNGFEKREYDFLYCDDVEEISAQCIDAEMGVWRVEIGFLEGGNVSTLDICTVGQLKMFLAIEGLDNMLNK